MKLHLFTALLLFSMLASAQIENKPKPEQVGQIDRIDSSDYFIVPVRGGEDGASNSKLLWSPGKYTNIIVYNAARDEAKRVFDENQAIDAYYEDGAALNAKFDRVLFYKVMSSDYNGDGKKDWKDPGILWVSNVKGNDLKQVTAEGEELESIQIFAKEGYALLRLSPDTNGDKSIDHKDGGTYYVKLDLKTLTFGNKIYATSGKK
jgi:hypothetical protein